MSELHKLNNTNINSVLILYILAPQGHLICYPIFINAQIQI